MHIELHDSPSRRRWTSARQDGVELFEPDPRWPAQFRKHLLRHRDDARRYADLEQGLAAAHPEDREAYTDGKAAFVREISKGALNDAPVDEPRPLEPP